MRSSVVSSARVAGAAPRQLGAGEVGAALGDAADVGHRVVELLEHAPALAELVEAELARLVGHAAPPDTGGSTATSSDGPTGVVGSAASPLTQIRHVGRTAANASP